MIISYYIPAGKMKGETMTDRMLTPEIRERMLHRGATLAPIVMMTAKAASTGRVPNQDELGGQDQYKIFLALISCMRAHLAAQRLDVDLIEVLIYMREHYSMPI